MCIYQSTITHGITVYNILNPSTQNIQIYSCFYSIGSRLISFCCNVPFLKQFMSPLISGFTTEHRNTLELSMVSPQPELHGFGFPLFYWSGFIILLIWKLSFWSFTVNWLLGHRKIAISKLLAYLMYLPLFSFSKYECSKSCCFRLLF